MKGDELFWKLVNEGDEAVWRAARELGQAGLLVNRVHMREELIAFRRVCERLVALGVPAAVLHEDLDVTEQWWSDGGGAVREPVEPADVKCEHDRYAESARRAAWSQWLHEHFGAPGNELIDLECAEDRELLAEALAGVVRDTPVKASDGSWLPGDVGRRMAG